MPTKDPELQKEKKLRCAQKHRERMQTDPEYRAKTQAYMKDYARKNAEKLRKASRDRCRLLSVELRTSRKGLELTEDFRKRIEETEVCDLCDGPPDGKWKRLAIDHCHSTGILRGMLCSTCNLGIGYFKDKPELLEKAAAYLRQYH